MISVAGGRRRHAALVIALALMTGFEEDMRQRILRGSAHLRLSSRRSPASTTRTNVLAKARAIPASRGGARAVLGRR